jgi:hypothetical protein
VQGIEKQGCSLMTLPAPSRPIGRHRCDHRLGQSCRYVTVTREPSTTIHSFMNSDAQTISGSVQFLAGALKELTASTCVSVCGCVWRLGRAPGHEAYDTH